MTLERTEQTYEPAMGRVAAAICFGPMLEAAQNIPGIHDVMSEPFDITNHAGNMWGGAAIAAAVTIGYALKNKINDDEIPQISEESKRNFNMRGVAAIIGATALVNCVTETKWGVQHLPVAEWLQGTTPDILDTMYSTAWGGILAIAFWKKSK